MVDKLITEERIHNISDGEGEKSKYLRSANTLSLGFRENCIALIDESSIKTMSQVRLLSEGVSRRIFKHPKESWAAYRIRVDHAEEWHYLGGSKKGMIKFLDYLGYSDYAFIKTRNYIPAAWNEFELHIYSGENLTLDDLEYLVMVVDHFKSSIAVGHTYRSGLFLIPAQVYVYSFTGSVNGISHHYPNSYDCSGSYENYDRLLITPIEP